MASSGRQRGVVVGGAAALLPGRTLRVPAARLPQVSPSVAPVASEDGFRDPQAACQMSADRRAPRRIVCLKLGRQLFAFQCLQSAALSAGTAAEPRGAAVRRRVPQCAEMRGKSNDCEGSVPGQTRVDAFPSRRVFISQTEIIHWFKTDGQVDKRGQAVSCVSCAYLTSLNFSTRIDTETSVARFVLILSLVPSGVLNVLIVP